jgi:hypothetical protein
MKTLLHIAMILSITISSESYLYWFPKPWKTRLNNRKLKTFYFKQKNTNQTKITS